MNNITVGFWIDISYMLSYVEYIACDALFSKVLVNLSQKYKPNTKTIKLLLDIVNDTDA
jgi:hypothetical protein